MVMAKKKPAKRGNTPWPAKLKALRERLGRITQAEAAARLGVSTATWVSWENNQRTPSATAARLLVITFPDLA